MRDDPLSVSSSYRQQARSCLQEALRELAAGDDGRLKYAALSLRMTIEALTYARAQAYRAELDESAYETWQPRKLLEHLLEIDENADQGGVLAVGREQTYGVAPDTFSVLGEEHVLSLAQIKANYDALGSYLHLPTFKQWREKRGPDAAKFRQRCEALVPALEKVLASRLHNIVFKDVASRLCERCGAEIVERVPRGGVDRAVKCRQCAAPYRLIAVGDAQAGYQAQMQTITCLSDGCSGVHDLWQDQAVEGTQWRCAVCDWPHRITLTIRSP